MFTHDQVWSAIDALAERHNMSVSRLARNAGLDPTTFNKSKRVSADGRLRWPSTESLHKIMQATGTSIENFTALIRGDDRAFIQALSGTEMEGIDATVPVAATVPLIGLAQAGHGGFFDDAGFPEGQGWDEIDFPGTGKEGVYALEISGDSMLPLYRDGDRIVVSPEAAIRRGDRVVVRTLEGEVMAKVLSRQTAKTVELESLNPDHPNRILQTQDIDWMARIVWASQ